MNNRSEMIIRYLAIISICGMVSGIAALSQVESRKQQTPTQKAVTEENMRLSQKLDRMAEDMYHFMEERQYPANMEYELPRAILSIMEMKKWVYGNFGRYAWLQIEKRM